MIYIQMGPTGLPLSIRTSYPNEMESRCQNWQSRWDWNSFEEVTRLASYVTAMMGKVYLPADNGPNVSPRFDIIEAPAVGDEVSYGFNGDFYPDGVITKITRNYTITTSTGNTYRRKRNTCGWYQPGGTWGLVAGHIDERNPHF